MKTKKKYVLIAVLAIILMMVITMLLNPLFLRTENQIRNNILRLTPIGMNMDDIISVIERENWRITERSSERGYINPRYPPGQRTVGEQFITVDLGKSSFLWFVYSSWVFDADGTLINVYVIRGSAN